MTAVRHWCALLFICLSVGDVLLASLLGHGFDEVTLSKLECSKQASP